MKKYVKPEMIYERYELSTHIADCSWELNQMEGSCNAYIPDQSKLPGMTGTLFTAAQACKWIPGVNWEDYCYHGGSVSANLHKS